MKYCPDVWKSLYIQKKSNETVDVGFCCQNRTDEIPNNIEALRSIIEKKQHDFKNNPNSSQCDNCWENEETGSPSRRHASINWFDNNHITSDTTNKLISLDWNSENICNLACISCGPKFSSRWRQEILNYSFNDSSHDKYINNLKDNKFWKLLDLSNLKRLYFNGGEPLLSLDHKEILAYLKEIQQLSEIELSYNTNGTIVPDNEVLDYWKNVKLLRISISIDAIDQAFDFIRWPAKWEQILTFIDFINQQSFNTIIDITCTIGIHNILEVDKLIAWQKTNLLTNMQGDPVTLNFQMVGKFSHGGTVLGLDNISRDLAGYILPQLIEIKNYSVWPTIEQILLNANSNNSGVDYLDELSTRRNINWKDHLPTLAESLRISQISGK
jgi:organic radical activating enzyme